MKLFLSSLLLLVATARADEDKPVTCGSVVKLTHIESGSKNYLFSENKNLGSGSGQQIVTWNSDRTSSGTLWRLRGENDLPEECDPGEPIKCGSKIRFTHLETKRNLHTHGIQSPISRQQEISGYGNDGNGDAGDDWTVECHAGKLWMRDQPVRFINASTGRYLGGSASVKFTQQNCGHGCPILNHLEAFGRKQKDDFSKIKVEMGILLNK
eukprot:CAMPEP_0194139468 /NCGR_PEP_ID=MMETSP0152-20130528/9098_1 /TAXON_ID=1049557 /ORGANISM="Thalassiothrix antarctica, Strain L6-D1" /LENGTH=210 /DNA_ID=CAMNT_0038837311 /DNA_START=18 /DNA_END=650 /DNA_ORIENTATION=-